MIATTNTKSERKLMPFSNLLEDMAKTMDME
jgi:hypothetical protein